MNIQDIIENFEERFRDKPVTTIAPVLVLAAVVAIPLLGIQTPASTFGSTLCPEAVSQSYVDSNAGVQYEDNTAFIVSTTTDGCGSELVGGGIQIPASELQDGDLKAASGFNGKLSGYNAFFEQQIQDDKNAYQLQFKRFDCGIYCGSSNRDEVEQWQDQGDTNLYRSKEATNVDGEAVIIASRAVQQGELKQLSSSTSTGFEASLQLCASGRCDTKTITQDRSTVQLSAGGFDAQATHTGSLVGDIRNIDFRGIVTPVETAGGRIYLTDPSIVNSYKDTLSGVSTCLSSNADNGVNNVRTVCGNDDELQNMYTSQDQIAEDSLSFNGDVRVQGSNIRTVTRDPNTFETQQIQWTIGAEWLGIFTEKASPTVGTVSDVEIGENSNRFIQVPVTNEGSSGDINVNVECDGVISGGSQQQFVSQGSTNSFNVEISSGSGTATGYRCVATATSVADATLTDSTSFTATLTDDGTTTPPPGPDPCEVNPDLPECQDGEDDFPWLLVIGAVSVGLLLAGAYMFRDRLTEVFNQ